MPNLLTRDEFRKAVFERDNYKCVVCQTPAQDAHHIIERRLFPDGGYYLDNGVSVCDFHHWEAEKTIIHPKELRKRAGIEKVVLPPHLYRDQEYDKWGNPIMPNGTRLKGELFHEESAQKILSDVLHLFTNKVKYPRTYHLPWSPGVTKDDRMMEPGLFEGKDVVVTIKMDGENTTMYQDCIHARSLEYCPHPSRDRVKAYWAEKSYNIPEGWRVCGENLFAKHSIHYQNLSHYFQMFSIWDGRNNCKSWEETKEWAQLLGLHLVPVLYEGPYDEEKIRSLYAQYKSEDECEGYVIRVQEEFSYNQFRSCVGKFVRANHVQTHSFWLNQQIVPNKVKID